MCVSPISALSNVVFWQHVIACIKLFLAMIKLPASHIGLQFDTKITILNIA